jgi:hypothetical protein
MRGRGIAWQEANRESHSGRKSVKKLMTKRFRQQSPAKERWLSMQRALITSIFVILLLVIMRSPLQSREKATLDGAAEANIKTAIAFLREMGSDKAAGNLGIKLAQGKIIPGRETDDSIFGNSMFIEEKYLLPAGRKTPLKRENPEDFLPLARLALFLHHNGIYSDLSPILRSGSAVTYAYGGDSPAQIYAGSLSMVELANWNSHYRGKPSSNEPGESWKAERKALIALFSEFAQDYTKGSFGEVAIARRDGTSLKVSEISGALAASMKEKAAGLDDQLTGIRLEERGAPLAVELSLTWFGKGIAAGDALLLKAENRGSRTLRFSLVPGMLITPADEKTQAMSLGLDEEETVTLAPGQTWSRTVRAFCLDCQKPCPADNQQVDYSFIANFDRYLPFIEIVRAGSRLWKERRFTPVLIPAEQYRTIVVQRALWKEQMKDSKQPHTRQVIADEIFFELERTGIQVSAKDSETFLHALWNDIEMTLREYPRNRPERKFFFEY